jgi:hypothetical protein
MEYTKEILSFLAWPVLIYVAYRLSLVALNIFRKNVEKTINTE